MRLTHEASNVIFAKAGKTHLIVALAETAIQSGQAAYFMAAHDLVTDLGRAYREGRVDRRLYIYLAPKVLIIGNQNNPMKICIGSSDSSYKMLHLLLLAIYWVAVLQVIGLIVSGITIICDVRREDSSFGGDKIIYRS